jgi:hypothetical protein
MRGLNGAKARRGVRENYPIFSLNEPKRTANARIMMQVHFITGISRALFRDPGW